MVSLMSQEIEIQALYPKSISSLRSRQPQLVKKDLIKNMGVYKLTFFDNLPNSNLLSLASNFYSNRDVN